MFLMSILHIVLASSTDFFISCYFVSLPGELFKVVTYLCHSTDQETKARCGLVTSTGSRDGSQGPGPTSPSPVLAQATLF